MHVILLTTQPCLEASRVSQLLRMSGLLVHEGTVLDFPILASTYEQAPLVLVTKRSFVDCTSLIKTLQRPSIVQQVWLTALTVLEREHLGNVSGAVVLPLEASVHTILGCMLGGMAHQLPQRLTLGELSLDYRSHVVETSYGSVQLTETCFRFFRRLVYANGQYVHYLDLWEELWGDRPFTNRNALAVVATRTRQMLPLDLSRRIQVRYGLGYRLMPTQKAAASRAV